MVCGVGDNSSIRALPFGCFDAPGSRPTKHLNGANQIFNTGVPSTLLRFISNRPRFASAKAMPPLPKPDPDPSGTNPILEGRFFQSSTSTIWLRLGRFVGKHKGTRYEPSPHRPRSLTSYHPNVGASSGLRGRTARQLGNKAGLQSKLFKP